MLTPRPVMNLSWFSLFHLYLLLQNSLVDLRVAATTPSGDVNVVIVGAGIGGTSCAYYLKKFLPNVDTVILEADSRVGGKVFDVHIDGKLFRIGTYAWTGNQRYIKELVTEMGLDRTDKDFDGEPNFASPFSFTVWNGTHLIDAREIAAAHEESMNVLGNGTVDYYLRVEKNYDFRGQDTFTGMEEFLSYGDLGQWATLEGRQYYTDIGVDLELQDLAMGPRQYLFSGQGMGSSVFSLYTHMATDMGRGQVVGGNLKLVKSLAEASGAKVLLNSTAKAVEKLLNGFNVVYQSDGKDYDMHADHVIIAAPIEHTGIDFTNFDDPVTQPARQWDPLYRYIVTAEGVNMDYFTTDPDYDVPGFIAGVPGKSDGFVLCNLEATVNDTMYYSLYTTRDIINDLQDILFNPSIKFTHYWPDGFNLLSPRDVDVAPYQDVVLSPRLYNIGVMSDVMDQMEGSIIAARNAALLIRKDIQSVSVANTFGSPVFMIFGVFTKVFVSLPV